MHPVTGMNVVAARPTRLSGVTCTSSGPGAYIFISCRVAAESRSNYTCINHIIRSATCDLDSAPMSATFRGLSIFSRYISNDDTFRCLGDIGMLVWVISQPKHPFILRHFAVLTGPAPFAGMADRSIRTGRRRQQSRNAHRRAGSTTTR